MISVVLAGAGLGTALFALGLTLVPPRLSPVIQLARFDLRDASVPSTSAAGLPGRLGAAALRALEGQGVRITTLRQDLALTGRSVEAVVGQKLIGATLSCAVVMSVAALLRAAGLGLPLIGSFVTALAAAVVFFLLPDVDARRVAARRRREFRRALSAYFDLVALEMAGSAAPTEALPQAARVGDGWPLVLLRDTLTRAALSGISQWDALADLGQRVGVSELRDLGGLVELVGRDGARIRQTLVARATSMRRRDLADAEGEAGRRDQSLLLAQVLIGFGFIGFIGYPAVATLMRL